MFCGLGEADRGSDNCLNCAEPFYATLDDRWYVDRVEPLNTILTEAKVKRSILKFLSDESGATAIEYGLIAAGIALAIIAVVNGLGTNLNDKFTSINNSLK